MVKNGLSVRIQLNPLLKQVGWLFCNIRSSLVVAPVLEAVDGGALEVRLGDLAHVERRLGPLLVAVSLLDEPIVVEGLDRRQLGAARAAAVAAKERRHPRGPPTEQLAGGHLRSLEHFIRGACYVRTPNTTPQLSAKKSVNLQAIQIDFMVGDEVINTVFTTVQ